VNQPSPLGYSFESVPQVAYRIDAEDGIENTILKWEPAAAIGYDEAGAVS
jgi:hypothetical protein